jgi:hypothetical protein
MLRLSLLRRLWTLVVARRSARSALVLVVVRQRRVSIHPARLSGSRIRRTNIVPVAAIVRLLSWLAVDVATL